MPKDTIVLSSRGTVGEMGLLFEPMAFNQSCYGLFTKDQEKFNQIFLYYKLKEEIRKLKGLAHGGVFDTFTKTTFDQIDIIYPENIDEQKRIVKILSAFDDEIEVNNKIAKTLGEMAQTLFKEWLIKFKFPGYEKAEFVGSELGRIPKDWKVGFIKDLGKVITGKTPSTEDKKNFGSEIPFITIPDLNSVFVIEAERYLSKKGSEKMQNMLLPARSICVSCIATVGLVGITTQQSLTNQQVNSIIPNKEELTYFLYIYFKNKKKDLELFGSGGTATLIINKTKFENLDLIIPDKHTLKDFHSMVKPMYEKILIITKENQKLAALRDLLLPKLMRGEVRV